MWRLSLPVPGTFAHIFAHISLWVYVNRSGAEASGGGHVPRKAMDGLGEHFAGALDGAHAKARLDR